MQLDEGCNLSVFCCKTAPSPYAEVSAETMVSRVGSYIMRTSLDVIASLRLVKALSCASPHTH